MSVAISWRSKSLDELQAVYEDEIVPEMRADGLDPSAEYPTYEWLADHGYRGLEDALRTCHDMTLVEFFTRTLGYDHRSTTTTTDYDWGISCEKTIAEFEDYLSSLRRRQGHAESTITSKRARLSRYAATYESLHGTSDLLEPTTGATIHSHESAETVAFRRAVETFDVLDADLSTDRSKLMYWQEMEQFYNRLMRWSKIQYNPVTEVPAEFDWDREQADNPALPSHGVKELYHATETESERLLILALAAWGLRPNEVACLHRSQLKQLDADDAYPYVDFDDSRKNGPGTVSILFGADIVSNRLVQLSNRAHWNGYLFPSSQSANGHITTKTVRNRFTKIAERTTVRVAGNTPSPKQCRRFWYTTYQDVMGTVYEQLDAIADEQGSASANVVEDRYLSEEARRNMRREYMRDALAEVFAAENA